MACMTGWSHRRGTVATRWSLVLLLAGSCRGGPIPPELHRVARRQAQARGDLLPLETKARLLEELVWAHHWSPENVLAYRVPAPYRDPPQALASDALAWSAVFAVALAIEARVEPSAQAQEDLHRALSGLDHLARVSGTPGLLARTVVRHDPRLLHDNPTPRCWVPGRGQHRGMDYSQYLWRADISKDMIGEWLLALVLGIPLCTDRELKAFLLEDLEQVASRIAAADYFLTEANGERTRWPDLRGDAGRWWLRCTRALPVDLWPFFDLAVGPGALLGVAVAEVHDHLCPDAPALGPERAERGEWEAIRAGVYSILGVPHHGNDFMTLIGAWAVLETDPPPELRHAVHEALRGLERRHRHEGNPVLNLLLLREGLIEEAERSTRLAQALDTLELYPLDRRLVPVDRRDLPGVSRRWLAPTLASHVVPINLRPSSSLFWKSDPHKLVQLAGPEQAHSGVDFLLAWRLYRSLRLQTKGSQSGADRGLQADHFRDRQAGGAGPDLPLHAADHDQHRRDPAGR